MNQTIGVATIVPGSSLGGGGVKTGDVLLTVFFSEVPVAGYAGAAACDTDAYGAWCRGLLARGVYPPPSQFEAWFLSAAHTARDVDRTIAAARAAMKDVARVTPAA